MVSIGSVSTMLPANLSLQPAQAGYAGRSAEFKR
jgi:hypothetical protein